MKYTRLFLLALIACVVIPNAYSQKYKWTRYYMEVGVLGGGSFYLGDVNTKLFNKTMATGGAFLKYKFNGRWESKFQTTSGMAGIGDVGGKEVKTFFADAALIAEFNFFNFAVMSLEPGASNISPYIFCRFRSVVFQRQCRSDSSDGIRSKMAFRKKVEFRCLLEFSENPLERQLRPRRQFAESAQIDVEQQRLVLYRCPIYIIRFLGDMPFL